MKLLRWIAVSALALILCVAAVALAARFSEGPLGPFPGGPLTEGDLVEEPVDDWRFADPVEEIRYDAPTGDTDTVWFFELTSQETD